MKNQWILGSIIAASSMFFFSSCDNTPTGETVDITILHTNDIHMHLENSTDTSAENPFGLGGLARLKTLIDQKRTLNPGNNLLLDAGDWSEGNITYAADAGVSILKMMTVMGYNAAAVGNHDFLINPMNMANVINTANASFPILGANMNLGSIANPKPITDAVKPYTIFDVNGVRIAVIGLLTEDFFYYNFFKPGIITNSFQAASAITKNIKSKNLADIIILLSHNSFDLNTQLAKTVPWVNAVISGHSHLKTPKAIEVTNAGQPVYVAETGQWSQFLGSLTLTYNRTTKQTVLKNFALTPVDKTIAEDKTIISMIADLKNRLSQKYGNGLFTDSLGQCDEDMIRSDQKEVPIANLAADSYLAQTGADFSMESVQLIGLGIAAGAITESSAFNVQPHVYMPTTGKTWTLKTLRIPGIQVSELLNLTFLANSLGLNLGWISLSGGRIIYKGEKTSGSFTPNPVQSILLKDKQTGAYLPISPQKIYSIALHDGILITIEILNEKLGLGIDLSQVQDSGVQAWESIASFINTAKIIKPENFESGDRYEPTGYDLSLAEHNVRISENENGYQVNVTVANEGLTASPVSSFSAATSVPNDIINDGTSLQTFIKIGADVVVPALKPGERQVLSFQWPLSAIPRSAIYSLKITLNIADENSRNNSVFLHPKLDKKAL